MAKTSFNWKPFPETQPREDEAWTEFLVLCDNPMYFAHRDAPMYRPHILMWSGKVFNMKPDRPIRYWARIPKLNTEKADVRLSA